jgi:tetrapyrrole methylase family protein / MazG family protein
MSDSKFLHLCAILDTLLGPNGCPWDKEQTLDTLRQYVLEETCELIDAIHQKDSEGMKEELGDLFFNVIFLAKVAAKEGHFTLDDTLDAISDKLIRRHPHIFGDSPQLDTAEAVLEQWQEIKKREREKPKSAMDSIPKSLPALERARLIAKKIEKSGFSFDAVEAATEEERIGLELFERAGELEKKGIHAEFALQKVCLAKEKAYRAHEGLL